MKRGITFIIFLTVIILSFQVVTAKHVWWHFWGGDVQSAPGICRECSLTIRGDANNDCRIDVSDGRYITAWLYSGGTGFCNGGRYYEPADANGDNRVDISDVRYITAWLFNGGPAPKPLSSSTQTSSCKDSDGRDYNNRGIVNITNRTGVFPHIDYCNADGRLVEYSCNKDGTNKITETVLCEGGCSNGVCLPEGPTGSRCTDTDGRNYNLRGIVNITNRTGVFPHIDFCDSNGRLNEYICNADNTNRLTEVITCEAGCSNGACIPPLNVAGQTCKDSDGRDYNNRGIVNITNRTGVFPHIDYCNADGRLVEYSCNTDETLNTQLQTCANGCFDGRCTRIQRAQLHRFRWRKEL